MSETIGAGACIGPYEIKGLLGEGPLGAVYNSRQESLGRDVALKIISAENAADPKVRERLGQELRAASALRNRHIATFYESGYAGGRIYLVSELIPASPISRLRLPLPPEPAVAVLKQMCEALAAAHAAGVTHHDLKPQNVLANRNGDVTLTDFGVSRALGEKALTAAGSSTADFAAPEIASGGQGDERSDIYSVGLLAYYLVTGDLPFHGSSALATIHKQIQDPLPNLPQSVPPGISEWIRHCAEKDPGQRFQKASLALEALDETILSPASLTTPASPGAVTGYSATVVSSPGTRPVREGPAPTPPRGGSEHPTQAIPLPRQLTPFEQDQVESTLREAHLFIGRANLAAAGEAADRVLAIDPGNLEVHTVRGRILEAQGDEIRAYREYKIACQSGDPNSEAQVRMANLLVRIPPSTMAMLQPSRKGAGSAIPTDVEERLPKEALAILRAAETVRPVIPMQQVGSASIASLVVPGLGQVLGEEYGKGLTMLGIWLVCLAVLLGVFKASVQAHHFDSGDPWLWICVVALILDYLVSIADVVASRTHHIA